MGDRDWPTERGAGDRGDSGRTRRSRADEPGAKPVTVEQLLARQGGGSPGHRRAARREEPAPRHEAAAPRYEASAARHEPANRARPGFPPVPAAQPARAPRHSRQPGLPPVPPAARPSRPVPLPADLHDLPPVRAGGKHPSLPLTPLRPVEEMLDRPSRPSTPIPPLPGLAPPPDAGRRRTGARRPRPERPPMSPGRRRVARAVTVLALVIGVIALYHLGLYFYVDQKIDRVDALAIDGPEVLAPALQDGTETYLIVGTGVPGTDGAASVSTLLASVSADGDRAALVSLPPTALVDTPECRRDDGSLREPTSEAFATALLDGGPSCLVRAVQQLSGLRIDHYLGVDFGRLPGMVDALGGVSVCVLPSPGAAAAARPLPSGRSEISGAAAAGYLRPQDEAADVTGAGVAERAQLLLTSTLRAAMAPATLVNTLTLTRFLARAADALTVDEQTTLGDLRVLASTLGDLKGDAVQRATLPVANASYTPAGGETPYVLLDPGATRQLFDSVIDQTRVPAEILAAQAEAAQAAAAEPPAASEEPAPAPDAEPAPQPLTVPPAQVTVDVLNGTGQTGLAGTVAGELGGQGFAVGTVGNEPGPVEHTIVRFGPQAAEQARTVAAAVPGAVLQQADGVGGVQLVIGPDYTAVVPVDMTPPAAPAQAEAPAETTAPAEEPAPVTC